MGRIPKVHDSIESGQILIQVESMDGLRIDRVKLTRLDDKSPSAQLPADGE
jgi:CBS domain containing-hemolysin-like protein